MTLQSDIMGDFEATLWTQQQRTWKNTTNITETNINKQTNTINIYVRYHRTKRSSTTKRGSKDALTSRVAGQVPCSRPYIISRWLTTQRDRGTTGHAATLLSSLLLTYYCGVVVPDFSSFNHQFVNIAELQTLLLAKLLVGEIFTWKLDNFLLNIFGLLSLSLYSLYSFLLR